MVAVLGVDAELVDYLEVVFAPVLDVDEGEVERGAIVTLEAVARAEDLGGFVDVRCDDLGEQAGELAVGEGDGVEFLELFAEVCFQCIPVADVGSMGVFEAGELLN